MLRWFRKNISDDEPNILIKRKFVTEGIKFYIYLEVENDKRLLKFPISYTKYFDLKNLVKKNFYLSLQVLEDLWNGGELQRNDDGSYFIDINTIYDLQDELIDFLEFESDEALKVEINSDLPVGSSNFSLSYNISHPELGYISNMNNRQGHFYPVNNNRVFLLNEDLVNLLELVDYPPKERKDQLKYVAQIKTLGKKLDVNFDDYLEKEEYYFPEELDADIEVKSNDFIELKPRFSDLDDDLNKEAEESLDNDQRYSHNKSDGKNKRVFFSDQISDDYTKLNKNREIRGADVPRFIENPAPFLPDSFDLDKFSDRVKGLKELVYRAQPYISGNSEDRDWFDFEAGVKLENDSEATESYNEDNDVENANNNDNNKLSTDKFADLVKEACAKGEDYILWDNKWVKIPDNSEDFINATSKANELLKGLQDENESGKVDKSRLPYIFDIYENIDKLEYSLDLLEFKEKLKQLDGIKYNRPNLLNSKYQLYPYQQQGYVWLNRLKLMSLGGLLADDMGLGKTLQVIAFMAKLKGKGQLTPSLVVAPSTLLENWKSEIDKFCPAINDIYIHHGGSRIKDSNIIKNSEVVITTYSTLSRDQLILGEIDWKVLVCDEAQKIKNNSTMAAHAVKAQKAMIRLALTGTPIENGLADLWSILDYVQPGLLGSFKTFSNDYIKPIEKCDELEELSDYEKSLTSLIKPVYIRRTKEEELKDKLPEKIEEVLTIEMSQRQKRLYNDIRRMQQDNGGTPLAALQKLINLSAHPSLVTGDWQHKSADELIEEGPKLKIIIGIIDEIKKKQEKVLIFTRSRKMQYIIQRVIREKFKLDYIPIINGASNGRLQSVNDFNNSVGFKCMILSPLAAGTGLNITGANHVIHYTRWWNPAVEQQATDRAYRIGQKKDVTIYYPISTSNMFETVEEKLNQLLIEKKRLATNIIVPNKKVEKDIKNELFKLVQ